MMLNISSMDMREPGYLRCERWKQRRMSGADVLCLCDTNGGTLPMQLAEMLSRRYANVSMAFSGSIRITIPNWLSRIRSWLSRPALRMCKVASTDTENGVGMPTFALSWPIWN